MKEVCTILVLLMLGTMAGLVLISWWMRTRPSIIQAPASHYDYVIVGGGTAGCVLAARLSADPNRSVLLVEAGHEFGWVSTIPLAAPLLQNTVHDWSYRTTPQLFSSWGLQDQTSAWPRGRGLGGSSQMNYLLHFSGSEADFQQWEALGAHGWSYENLKPYIDQLLGVTAG
ncbi:uncharacterized protein [Anabrus simplex]|uniref:uncharacterized protein n=1 Tax=Anabrus simplex TaxID=316456 RepID=UPI0035A2C28F